jgi:membrane-associated phospholipid phosphatase
MASQAMHHAGAIQRERPLLRVDEARTPITNCGGIWMIAQRDAAGPTAACEADTPTALANEESSAVGEEAAALGEDATGVGEVTATPAAQLVGLDWRDTWINYATFPSGHMREVAALCLLMVVFWRATRWLALGLALVMAFSRVHLGAHYPSDVLVGGVLGLWTAGTALVGLDVVRRLVAELHEVPAVARTWDWVFGSREPRRPDLDPALARAIRVGVFAALANVVLVALGLTATSPAMSQIHTVMQNADAWVKDVVQAWFDPQLASALYLALGSAGLLYLLLAGALLGYVGRTCPRNLPATGLALVVSLLLAVEMWWVGGMLFPREAPAGQLEGMPWSARWLETWTAQHSFPSLHALLATALAALLAATWREVAVPAQAVAVAASLTAAFIGAAWVTDALAGYVLGNVAASFGQYLTSQLVAPREVFECAPRTASAERGLPVHRRSAAGGS